MAFVSGGSGSGNKGFFAIFTKETLFIAFFAIFDYMQTSTMGASMVFIGRYGIYCYLQVSENIHLDFFKLLINQVKHKVYKFVEYANHKNFSIFPCIITII